MAEEEAPRLDLDMVVIRRESMKSAGKPIKYRVILVDGNNNRLTLVANSSAVFEGFPENVMFQVKVRKVQAVLAKTFEHVVEEPEEE